MATVTIEVTELSPTLQKYKEMFGHEPSIEAEKFLTPTELDKMAAEAIAQGQPVSEWRDRPITTTGSYLDDLYHS